MPHTTYPATSDVQAYATAQGTTVDATQCAATLAAVIAEWERRTRFVPFLAESSDSVSYFDGGSRALFLPGYVSITSVYHGITATESGGTVTYSDGTRAYANVGFYERRQWDSTTAPITWLEWNIAIAAGNGSVKVTGKRGAFVNLPDDVWQGLIQRAGDQSIAAVSNPIMGATEIDVGRGDQRVKFASASAVAAAYEKEFDGLVRRYRRATL